MILYFHLLERTGLTVGFG